MQVVAWVLTHHAGDAVRLGPYEKLTRPTAGESAAPTEARARWAELPLTLTHTDRGGGGGVRRWQ